MLYFFKAFLNTILSLKDILSINFDLKMDDLQNGLTTSEVL